MATNMHLLLRGIGNHWRVMGLAKDPRGGSRSIRHILPHRWLIRDTTTGSGLSQPPEEAYHSRDYVHAARYAVRFSSRFSRSTGSFRTGTPKSPTASPSAVGRID